MAIIIIKHSFNELTGKKNFFLTPMEKTTLDQSKAPNWFIFSKASARKLLPTEKESFPISKWSHMPLLIFFFPEYAEWSEKP